MTLNDLKDYIQVRGMASLVASMFELFASGKLAETQHDLLSRSIS